MITAALAGGGFLETMPIAVIKYRCKFKCGARSSDSKKKMESHETKCYKNPDNKTCVTCGNQIYTKDSDDHGNKWFYRGCKIEKMNQFFEELHEKMIVGDSVKHVKPVFNCPNWNHKYEQQGTDYYINDIRPKIEIAHMLREQSKEPIKDLPF